MIIDPLKEAGAKLGAKGRAVNSPAQKTASRLNGKLGGRPLKKTAQNAPGDDETGSNSAAN